MRSEGFYVKENPLTPAGIEPATFRIVAQHRGPLWYLIGSINALSVGEVTLILRLVHHVTGLFLVLTEYGHQQHLLV